METTTTGTNETRCFGERLANSLHAGDVVLLVGELGTGKTTLVKGLVAALGGGDQVTSPTFTIAHHYPSNPPVTHVDLWRLEHLQEIVDLALDEALEDGGVVVAEWGEAAAPLFGSDALLVHLSRTDRDEERLIQLETRGERWASRRASLIETLANDGRGSASRPGQASGGGTGPPSPS